MEVWYIAPGCSFVYPKRGYLLTKDISSIISHVSLVQHTHTGIIPQSWRRYTVPSRLTVIQWVTDFSERVKQLHEISQQVASNGAKVLKVGS